MALNAFHILALSGSQIKSNLVNNKGLEKLQKLLKHAHMIDKNNRMNLVLRWYYKLCC